MGNLEIVLYGALILLVILSLVASFRVKSVFKKYSKIPSLRGFTGAAAARAVLDSKGLYGVAVSQTSGELTDHFDPRTNTVYLSDSVYGAASSAAVGVAAHEAGHAIQHAEEYAPMKLRSAILPVANFTSRFAPYLVIGGILLSAYAEKLIVIAYIGLIGYAAAALFQLLTLFAEFDASSRALVCLQSEGIVDSESLSGSKKVLRAAAMTYVAALATSVVQLLRMLLIVMSSDSRRRR
ncbi:MAG: zinc metallopeptidase [Clostridia bacterium]|nr:zinc metallopeptidase [Clostridia bacterium]